jgi:predicted RNA binding protein YcfA (HicA-like mRNA interferase family)
MTAADYAPASSAGARCDTSRGAAVGLDSRIIIRDLRADGWEFAGATGSHHHFRHPTKQGKVTVPHPKKDLHPKTVRSIYRQAGLKEPR